MMPGILEMLERVAKSKGACWGCGGTSAVRAVLCVLAGCCRPLAHSGWVLGVAACGPSWRIEGCSSGD